MGVRSYPGPVGIQGLEPHLRRPRRRALTPTRYPEVEKAGIEPARQRLQGATATVAVIPIVDRPGFEPGTSPHAMGVLCQLELAAQGRRAPNHMGTPEPHGNTRRARRHQRQADPACLPRVIKRPSIGRLTLVWCSRYGILNSLATGWPVNEARKDGRNRTRTRGFGDRCSAVELRP
jgi:hypothetical protein